MSRDISNTDKYIDSRDIIKRIDELESEMKGHLESVADHFDGDEDTQGDIVDGKHEPHEVLRLIEALPEGARDDARDAVSDWEHWEDMEFDELEALRELRDECESSPDWHHGETLIHDDEFANYAEQTARDCVSGNFDAWPLNEIDWERAAEALQSDYMDVEFGNQTYWIRA